MTIGENGTNAEFRREKDCAMSIAFTAKKYARRKGGRNNCVDLQSLLGKKSFSSGGPVDRAWFEPNWVGSLGGWRKGGGGPEEKRGGGKGRKTDADDA